MANPRILLANAVTGTGAQTRSAVQLPSTMAPVQPINGFGIIRLVGTGAITATVLIEGSLNDSSYSTAATFTLSGSGLVTFPYVLTASFPWLRANVSAISGTAATLDVVFEYTPINQ